METSGPATNPIQRISAEPREEEVMTGAAAGVVEVAGPDWADSGAVKPCDRAGVTQECEKTSLVEGGGMGRGGSH